MLTVEDLTFQHASCLTHSACFLQRVRIAGNADPSNSYAISVRPSICPSRSGVVQINKHTIVRSSE